MRSIADASAPPANDESPASPIADGPAPVQASVVVCTYNRSRQVLTCLNSLLNLTHPDFEIVLVDDASTDDTPSVLEEFRAVHPRIPIRIVRHETNLGVTGAWNTGLLSACGEYVFFTDSDCTVEPGWLSELVAGFDGPDIVAVAGAVNEPPPRNWPEMARWGGNRIGRSDLQARRLIGCNMGFRRSIAKNFLFDLKLRFYSGEDDLARRLENAGHRLAFCPDAAVTHDHPVSLRSYLRLAWKQGQGSAHYWRKHGIVIGRDLWFALATLLTLPAIVLGMPYAAIPLVCLCLQCLAILYNSLWWKQQPVWMALATMPLQLTGSFIKLYSTLQSHLQFCMSRLRGRHA